MFGSIKQRFLSTKFRLYSGKIREIRVLILCTTQSMWPAVPSTPLSDAPDRFFNTVWLIMNDLSLGIAFGSFLLENDDALARMANFSIQVRWKVCQYSPSAERILRDTFSMHHELYSSGWMHGQQA